MYTEVRLNAILTFQGSDRLSFPEITPEWLKHFEGSLRARGCSWNTVSTYLRTLRAVYNRAVDLRKRIIRAASFSLRIYRYAGRPPSGIGYGGYEEGICPSVAVGRHHSCHEGVRRSCSFLCSCFGDCLLSTLAYLRKSDLRGNVISYRRRKTGRPLSVTLTSEAMFLLKKYMNREEQSPYLFPILHSDEGSPMAYREYQLALRNFNYQLELVGKVLGLKDRLSSYTARHTWATTAYYCEIHPGIISEAMGHSSITVTETYLKPFRSKKIDEANKQVLDFVKRS